MIIYFHKGKKFVDVLKKDVMDYLYYDVARTWGYKNVDDKNIYVLKNNKFVKTDKIIDPTQLDKLKDNVSKINTKIPLYDIFSDNIYLIFRENLYNRVIYGFYRFPDDAHHNKPFLKNFNMKILNDTYVSTFYYYSNKVGKNITHCLRPSFLSYLKHIKPYYSRSEIINMALNMKLIKPDDTYYDKSKVKKLCDKVKTNDIDKTIILSHQKHIVKANGIASVIYYSLHGAFFMNRYLRQKNKKNNFLVDKNIDNLWKLIKTAPPFNKSYVLYRFVHTDKHINDLNVGDTYIEPSFISTTRDPFYNSEEYRFGFVLIKIKIPKDIKGVALCIETFSNFKKEQEIVFPPLTILKLVNKNEKADYFHIDDQFSKKVVTKYEFEYIGNKNIPNKKIKIKTEDKITNINNIKLPTSNSFLNKVNSFIKKYTNNNFQFTTILNNKKYIFATEWYNSNGAYKPFYFINSDNGFSIYCQNPETSNMSLVVEFTNNQAHVNFYSKYCYSDDYIDLTNKDVLLFISYIAYIFGIGNIFIHLKYKLCSEFINPNDNSYKKRILEMHTYRKDYYDYFTSKKKRFDDLNITPKFFYYQLDKLFNIPIKHILNKTDKDELYQLFIKLNKNMSFVDFYIYIIKNYPNHIDILESKTNRIFKNDNPFVVDYYYLNGYRYLYNNNVIKTMPTIIPTSNGCPISDNNTPKNKSTYRLLTRKMII